MAASPLAQHLPALFGPSRRAAWRLGVLRRAGLATSTRDATRHLYVLNTDGLAAVRSYLDDFWPTTRPRASHRVPISGAPGIIHPIEEHHP